MSSSRKPQPETLWARHNEQWRKPAQIVSQWREAAQTSPELLEMRVRGAWWQILEKTGATLLITREYEHLIIAVSASKGRPRVSYHPLPHPSGLTVDRKRAVVYVASTRNPNQVYELRPAIGMQDRLDCASSPVDDRPLIPLRSWFLPGCLYIHDLALVGGRLHANAVGQNAIVRLSDDADYQRVWWPRCIERGGQPLFGRNHLQLNSIAAGANLRASYFSASCDQVGARRPGHRNFAVDRRGVIFSGRTREPVATGLTRPHSARLHAGQVWVNNSGYGEVGFAEDGKFAVVAKLPGWTRGLCFCGPVMFVGTSRVIPRFRQYAPGLDAEASQCAVHALETTTGRVLGSLSWPAGNQIFAIDWISCRDSLGFPFRVTGTKSPVRDKNLFYSFEVNNRST